MEQMVIQGTNEESTAGIKRVPAMIVLILYDGMKVGDWF